MFFGVSCWVCCACLLGELAHFPCAVCGGPGNFRFFVHLCGGFQELINIAQLTRNGEYGYVVCEYGEAWEKLVHAIQNMTFFIVKNRFLNPDANCEVKFMIQFAKYYHQFFVWQKFHVRHGGGVS